MQQNTAGPASHINLPVDREIHDAAKRKSFITFLVFAFLALWVGTEVFAFVFEFDNKALGDQLLAPGLPFIYNPWALVWPWGKFLFANFRDPGFAQTAHIKMGIAWAAFFIGSAIGWKISRKQKPRHIDNAPRPHDFEGSAHWATPVEVGGTRLLPPDHWASIEAYNKAKKANDKLSKPTLDLDEINEWKTKPGIYVGEWIDPKTKKRIWLRDTSDRHVGLYAPTRGGKGVGIIIPACLTWSESLVVNDPKAEIYVLTAWYRKYKMGQNIFKFDPVCQDGTGARINVLDFVRLRTEHEVADAQNIAKMLCDPQGLGLDTGSESDHWRKTAYAFLTGAILHVLYSREIPKEKKNLTGVDEFLSNPTKSQTKIFNEMLSYEHDPNIERCWIALDGKPTKTCPTVAMAARDMLDRPEGERGSVMSSVKSYFDLYRDPIVAQNICVSDFSFEDLMYADKAATLYLVNNPDNMERVRPLMRLIVNVIMTTFTGSMDFKEDGRPKPKYKHKMLMLMDEFTSTLSKMSIFANAISFVAGYGIKVLIVVQDLVQLAETYGDKGAQALTSNIHTQIIYATNNPETSRQFSQMLGNQTMRQETRSWNGGKASRSESYRGRALLDASEIQSLPETDEIVLVTNHSPIYCKKIIYWKETAFTQRIKAMPKGQPSDRIPMEQQAFYKDLVTKQEEARAKAEERRKGAEAKVAVAAASTVEKVATKKFTDLIDIADEDSSEAIDGLKGII